MIEFIDSWRYPAVMTVLMLVGAIITFLAGNYTASDSLVLAAFGFSGWAREQYKTSQRQQVPL